MITETADAAALPRPSRRGAASAVVVPLLLVALTAALVAVDYSGPPAVGGAAAAFVPPDGFATRSVTEDDSIDATEHARLVGAEGILTAPDSIASGIIGALPEGSVQSAQLWRERVTTQEGDQYHDLYVLDSDGVSEVAAWGGSIGFVFSPPILVLPAHVAAGESWASEGSALGDGLLSYSSSYSARSGEKHGDSCLEIDGELTIEQAEAGPVLESKNTSVWCPGRGRISSTGEQNGASVASSLTTATLSAATAVTLSVEPTGASAMLDTVHIDAFFGESPRESTVAIAPVVTKSELVVVSNERGDDLHAWRSTGERTELEWSAHPGGVVVALGVVGDVVLASTANREVVAFDAIGRRLWSQRGDDLALSSPVGIGDDAIIARRDGAISRVRAATGVTRWTAHLGADARGGAVVGDNTVVIADERERLTSIDLDSGKVLWQVELGAIDAVASHGRGAIALTEDGEIVAIDAHGEERWDARSTGLARGLVIAGDALIIATDERLVARSVTDGRELWSGPGADSVVAIGGSGPDALVAASTDDGAITVRNSDGRIVVDDAPPPTSETSLQRFLLAFHSGLLVVDGSGGFRWVGVQ